MLQQCTMFAILPLFIDENTRYDPTCEYSLQVPKKKAGQPTAAEGLGSVHISFISFFKMWNGDLGRCIVSGDPDFIYVFYLY